MLGKKPFSSQLGYWDSDGSQAVSVGKMRDENIMEIDSENPSSNQKLKVN